MTDGYAGAAPDQGAYEAGQATWLSGCTFTPECGDASMSKVTIVARHSGKDVGVDGTAAQTTQQTDSGSAAQQWAVLPQAGGTAQIKNLATGLCLAVAGQRTDDLAPVYQWACSTAPNFLWNVRDTEGVTSRSWAPSPASASTCTASAPPTGPASSSTPAARSATWSSRSSRSSDDRPRGSAGN